MRKRSKLSILLGCLFLAIGVLWLSVIYVRCHGYLPWQRTNVSSGPAIPPTEETLLKDLPIKEFLSGEGIVLFRAIACWELVTAFFFLLSGLSLLRGYAFRRIFAIASLAADLILKIAIVTYQQNVILPLKDIFRETNILLVHFAPNANLTARISAFLSGVKLIQPGGLYYAVGYGAVFTVLLCLLAHPKSGTDI